MKTINRDTAIELIRTHINSFSEDQKPILIWFHSNKDIDKLHHAAKRLLDGFHITSHPFYGHKHFIYDGEVKLLDDYPEIAKKFHSPSGINKNTKFLLYHRYNEQLKSEHIAYILELMRYQKLPLVCFINDYSTVTDCDLSMFDEYDYPMEEDDWIR